MSIILPAYLVGSGLKHCDKTLMQYAPDNSPGLFSREWIETLCSQHLSTTMSEFSRLI